MIYKQRDWYRTWFNTKYYHILYKDRDFNEAAHFVDELVQFLEPEPNARFLDLACGKGRHALYLSKKGYHVLGTDLSEESIAFAKRKETENLDFLVNDMRTEIEGYSFDFILNLFTSFGYFESRNDDLQVIKACSNMLNKDGKFVIDYINIEKAISDLVPFEIKNIEGFEFHIKKFMEAGFIKKEINFIDPDTTEKFNFHEKVRVYYQEDFEGMFEEAGLKVEHVFGDYDLNPYHAEESDRLIFVTSKQ